jgi:hypothetical protein
MNKYTLILISIFLFLFLSPRAQSQLFINGVTYDYGCNEIKISKDTIDSLVISDQLIEKSDIKDNCLHLLVGFGGGCGKIYFELVWTGEIMESNPPQVQFNLKSLDQDLCKAFLHCDIYFDLSSFKQYAQEGGIFIRVGNYVLLYKN